MKAVLNRLLIWQKLAIVTFLGIVIMALPLGLYLDKMYEDYAFSKRETQGIGPALTVLKTLQDSQQHRGIAAQTVAGRSEAEPRRAAMQANVEKHIAKMESEFADAVANKKIGGAWRAAVKEWGALAENVRNKSITVEQSYQRHTSLSYVWSTPWSKCATNTTSR